MATSTDVGASTTLPSHLESSSSWRAYRRYALALLFVVSSLNYLDRYVLAVVMEPIKLEFHLSDTELGLLSGIAFALFYATMGIPLARLADRGNRRIIVSLVVLVWSGMTMLCGTAQNFISLLIARVGVGVGESGAIPPAHSLISDYYAPADRGGALALITFGSTVGYVIAFMIGGQVAGEYGWRSVFILAGAPGLLVALVAWFTLYEPRESHPQLLSASANSQEDFKTTILGLLRKRSYRQLVIGYSLFAFVAYGAVQWTAPFLMRVHAMPIDRMGTVYGLVGAGSATIGVFLGGFAADYMARRHVRWLALVPAIACTCAYPTFVASFLVGDLNLVLAINFLSSTAIGALLPGLYAGLHIITGPARRATGIAVAFCIANLVGMGLGPLAVGMVSDALEPSMGAESIRYSLIISFAMLVWAAVHFYLAANTIAEEAEEAIAGTKVR